MLSLQCVGLDKGTYFSLFVCPLIDRLFQLINVAVEHGFLNPIRLVRGGPLLSHLAFADDLLLFAEVSVDQVEVIQVVLDLFCRSSGEKVSVDKKRIYFSHNVSWQVKEDISNPFGYRRTDDLGKYLGIPILHKRVSNHTFQFLLDKVNNRLSNWKGKMLSMAGRITLAKSVIQVIPSYVMQTVFLPMHVCDEIDRICRRFVWGDEDNHRKVHTVPWNEVCMPKNSGGLRLKSMRDMNRAFMMKAGWRLCVRRKALWAKVVRSKYNSGSDEKLQVDTDKKGSNFWRGICKNWGDLRRILLGG